MLFKNLTPVSLPGRSAGWFTSLALAALLSSVPAMAQNAAPGTDPVQQSSTPSSTQQPGNAAPGTAPIQQPSSSSTTPQTGNAAPGTAPITTHTTAAALAPGRGPSYMNRWDVYGGLAFMNGQAGQNVAKRFNMGGGEGQFTYWMTHKLGIAADYRFGAGTTPVYPSGAIATAGFNRVLVMEHIFAGGVQYRGPHNRYVAINYHVFGGGDYGIFDHAVTNFPGVSPVSACPIEQPGQVGNLGLYCNHIAPWGAVGGSIDFNQGQKFAVRLAPDLTFEHFGTETREFFGISLGVLYRGGRH
jgi:hypothetical protein